MIGMCNEVEYIVKIVLKSSKKVYACRGRLQMLFADSLSKLVMEDRSREMKAEGERRQAVLVCTVKNHF
jgi:hypothetical protein